ncbi:biotin-dependent carboxyltransferase family protein [Fodinicola acaciae]|uniref:5-oxoprolinase subunit C family protein n=1 Tax=Fodinicola acaciae TaxID=2681555 RepID=UPI0013D0B602|nr:biotin-dependent carboxyltransferase family protein [Fodinicola acaciae]
MIRIVRPGPLTTVQDLGRPGYLALGVGTSGAADRQSLRLANRLVGNAESAAGLEATFGGLSMVFLEPATIALTGAPVPAVLGGRPVSMNSPISVPSGAKLELGRPSEGMRTYLAVRGGLDVPEVLGSRSTDVLSGLGPPKVAAGDVFPFGSATVGPPNVDLAPVPRLPIEPVLRVVAGPRDDWFASLRPLLTGRYEVSPDSNRVGVRLRGSALERVRSGELPSEGMVTGSLQVPPDGQPVLFLADHPVTGGYPVAAVVCSADISLAAQLRPGQSVRFRLTTAH